LGISSLKLHIKGYLKLGIPNKELMILNMFNQSTNHS